MTGVIPLSLSDHYIPYTIIRNSILHPPRQTLLLSEITKHLSRPHLRTFYIKPCPTLHNVFPARTWMSMMHGWRGNKYIACDAHVPLRTIRAKNRHNPWMTGDLLSFLCTNETVWRRKPLKLRTRTHRNSISYFVIKSSTPLSKLSDPTTKNRWTWTLATRLLCARHSDIVLGLQPDQSVPSNISADTFNNYFASIGTKPADGLDNVPYSSSLPHAINSFELQSVSVNFIYNQLLLLKDKSNIDFINIDSKMMQIGSITNNNF